MYVRGHLWTKGKVGGAAQAPRSTQSLIGKRALVAVPPKSELAWANCWAIEERDIWINTGSEAVYSTRLSSWIRCYCVYFDEGS